MGTIRQITAVALWVPTMGCLVGGSTLIVGFAVAGYFVRRLEGGRKDADAFVEWVRAGFFPNVDDFPESK